MEDWERFTNQPLHGGILLKSVRAVTQPMLDALGRPALARTVVIGLTMEIELQSGLSEKEISISLYHEVLEAATVAVSRPPAQVCEMNEAGFESAAQKMHAALGVAVPAKLNRMLELFGF